MKPVLFHLGSHPVYAYGFALTVAFLVGTWLAARRAPARGLSERDIFATGTLAFLAALLGSRLVFLLTDDPSRLLNPAEWVRVWDGGLVFYGGFFGAVGSSFLYARAAQISFWILADVVAPSIALGHGIVRIGCFLNGCCYGKPATWGVVFPALGDGIRRQPAQLYEAAAGVILFAALLYWEKRVPRVRGDLILLYAAAYGAARFFIELTRDDDRGGTVLGLTISQLFGLVAFLAGGICLAARIPPARARTVR